MRLPLSFALLLPLAMPVLAQDKQPKLPNLPPDLLAPTDSLSPADERKQFTLPPGFDAQLVASEPDIQKPMQLAFDAKGRMWVTTSHHYPFAVAKGKGTDKLFVLSDIDPKTGKAGKVQVFASDLNIPIGILPLPDCQSCIVSSIGEIRKYTDTDGDGKADKSEVLFTGFGFDDTHGMYNSYTLMPDGWVYACHGFRNDSTVKGKDGHEVKMQSGHTFRFRPDGSRIEVWTRGQVNPFGMTVDPWFNLYTADCHSKPITQLIPGAYYQSFGKPHDGLGFAPHVTAHSHNSTGLCGIAWYDADQFPKDFLGTVFVGNVVTNRINFDRIEWKGATPVAKELPDFLVSKDRWFRPVDIKLGPDGALYVADFYNKIIGHYEVDLKDPRRDKDRGRIWRIVWKGKDGKVAPPKFHRDDFTKAKLLDLLDDAQNNPNLTVRALATQQAILRLQTEQKLSPGAATASFLKQTSLLTGANRPEPGSTYRHAILTIRILASRTEWTDVERKEVLQALGEKGDQHRRACVEAVILHPHADFVKPVVEVLKKTPAEDTHLRQAARIALRNCLRDIETWPKGDDAVFVEMAVAIPNREAAQYLASRMKAKTLPANMLNAAAEHIARHGAAADEEFLFTHLTTSPTNADAVLAAFKGVQARGAKLGATATKQLLDRAQSAVTANPSDAKATLWGLRVLTALPTVVAAKDLKLAPDSIQEMTAAVAAPKAPTEVRVGAAETLLLYSPVEGLRAVKKQLTEPATPEAVKTGLLLVAASSKLPGVQAEARDALKTVPYRVAVPIGLALAGTKDGAEMLFDAVKTGAAPARLLQENAIIERLRGSNPPGWGKRVVDLTRNLPPADQRIAGLIRTRAVEFANAKPDVEKGAKLFTQHCSACHKIGDTGGKIAPQLDGVGVRGTERLLEDILDPNRNVDGAFRARSITLKSEKTLTALMLRVEGQVLVVADLEGKEQRIPLEDIETNRETQLSAMPANFADVIPAADLPHLLAYLLEQKQKEPPKK